LKDLKDFVPEKLTRFSGSHSLVRIGIERESRKEKV
jgi:hypothetical protein